jgi:rhodanese-related sulfurtransferase
MKHAIRRSPALSLLSLGWPAALLLALGGCDAATSDSVDAVVDDAAVPAKADAAAPPVTSDGPSSAADARGQDATTPRADAVDARVVRADAVGSDADRISDDADALDTVPDSGKDAGPEATAGRADAVASDSARPRTDVATVADTSLRGDAVAPDTLVEDPDAETLPCQASVEPVTMGHLTAQELKAILDGPEDPYLINVKGTSIANIPGTDAVLVSDVPGIEELVGGNLCADIILYCRSGNTSQMVGAELIAKGYLNVRDLEGGIGAWTAAGYPTE